MLYVTGDGAGSVPVGAAVDLTVQSVSAKRYGTLRGKIAAIGAEPESKTQITDFLGSSTLGDVFSAKGSPVAVLVQLSTDAGTKSGYAWSSSSGGPPTALSSMTPVSASVVLSEQRPLDWLLP
jgi:hypothetical protein